MILGYLKLQTRKPRIPKGQQYLLKKIPSISDPALFKSGLFKSLLYTESRLILGSEIIVILDLPFSFSVKYFAMRK